MLIPTRRKNKVAPFLAYSILLHILILAAFPLYSSLLKAEQAPEPQNFIELTEIPVPEEKETEPPKETKRLAERSHKAVRETTRDQFTKRGNPVQLPRPPAPPPRRPETKPTETKEPLKAEKPKKITQVKPKAKPQEKPQEKPREKPQEKPPEKPKETDDANIRVASLPRRDRALDPRPQSRPESKRTPSEPRVPTREELFRMPAPSVPYRGAPSQNFLGDPRVNVFEDTVDLDTTEYKYLSYFMKMKQQIEGIWKYPRESARRGERGQLRVVFTIKKDGQLAGITLLNSSLHTRLDDEAIRAITVAAPYNPFPKAWEGMERLNVRAVFVYHSGRWTLNR